MSVAVGLGMLVRGLHAAGYAFEKDFLAQELAKCATAICGDNADAARAAVAYGVDVANSARSDPNSAPGVGALLQTLQCVGVHMPHRESLCIYLVSLWQASGPQPF